MLLNETENISKALFGFCVYYILPVRLCWGVCVCVCVCSAAVVGNICSEAENVTRNCKMLHRDKFHILNFSLSAFRAINILLAGILESKCAK